MEDNNNKHFNSYSNKNIKNEEDERNNSLNKNINKKTRYEDIYNLLYSINNNNEEENNERKISKYKSNSHRYYNVIDINNFNLLRKNQQKSKIYNDKLFLLYDKIYSIQKKSLKNVNSNNNNLIKENQNEEMNFNNKKNIKSQFQIFSFDNNKKKYDQPNKLLKYKKKIYFPIEKNESNKFDNNIFSGGEKNYNTISSFNSLINKEKNNIFIDKKNEIRDLLHFNNYNINHNKNNINEKKNYSGTYFIYELKRFTNFLNNSEDIKSKIKRLYFND